MSGRTGIFLQVRLGSTRLPAKALLELEGKAVIRHAMEALIHVNADCRVLLTDPESSSRLRPLADACGFSLYEGSADDVLNRYVSAADEYGTQTIIRATGDNPLVSAAAANLIAESHSKTGADYSGFDGMPLGTGVEVLDAGALRRAEQESSDPYDHEHVSPYLYRNPDTFKINRINAPPVLCLEGSIVTLDTQEDYDYLKRLFAELYRGRPLEIGEIIPWLKLNGRSI